MNRTLISRLNCILSNREYLNKFNLNNKVFNIRISKLTNVNNENEKLISTNSRKKYHKPPPIDLKSTTAVFTIYVPKLTLKGNFFPCC